MKKKNKRKFKFIIDFQNWLTSDKTSNRLRKILIYAIAIIIAITVYPNLFKEKIVETAEATQMTMYSDIRPGGTFAQGPVFNPGFQVEGADARGDYLYYWGSHYVGRAQIVQVGVNYVFQNPQTIRVKRQMFGGWDLHARSGKIVFNGTRLAIICEESVIQIYDIAGNNFAFEKEFEVGLSIRGVLPVGPNRMLAWGEFAGALRHRIAIFQGPPNYTLENDTLSTPDLLTNVVVGGDRQIFALNKENNEQDNRLTRFDGTIAAPPPGGYPKVFEKVFNLTNMPSDKMSLVSNNILVLYTSRKPGIVANLEFTIFNIATNTWKDYYEVDQPPEMELYNQDMFFGVGQNYIVKTGDDTTRLGWTAIGSDYRALNYAGGIANIQVGGGGYLDFSPSQRIPIIKGGTAVGSSDFALFNFGRKIKFFHIDFGLPPPNQVSLIGEVNTVPFDVKFTVPAYVNNNWVLVAFEGYSPIISTSSQIELNKTDYYPGGVPDYSLNRNNNSIFLGGDTELKYTIDYKNVPARNPLDVILIYDSTASMNNLWNGVRKHDLARDALKYFTTLVRPALDRVGIVMFSTGEASGCDDIWWLPSCQLDPIYKVRMVDILQMTNNFVNVRNWIDTKNIAEGQTSLGAPIIAGNKMLEWDGRDIEPVTGKPVRKVMIFATDGQNSLEPFHDEGPGDSWSDCGVVKTCPWPAIDDWGSPTCCWDSTYLHNDKAIIQTTRDLGLPIYVVGIGGLGALYDKDTLDQISGYTGGITIEANPDELRAAFAKIANILLGGIEDTIPVGTNLKNIIIAGNTFTWDPAINAFNPNPAALGYEITYDPATGKVTWLNAEGDGLFEITINIPGNWIQLYGLDKLKNTVKAGDANSYDETNVTTGDIMAIGDVFAPGIEGQTPYVSVSSGAVATFKGEWIFTDYHFRRGTMMDWREVQNKAITDWPELEAQSLVLPPLVGPGMTIDLNFGNPNGIWRTAGDLSIPDGTEIEGKGTILVNGNLNIQGNVSYVNISTDSVGFIVKGSVNVTGNTTQVVGNYLVLPVGAPGAGEFIVQEPNPNTKVFRLRGLVVANEFTFNRLQAVNHPSVIFVYDGSAITKTPPGFKQIFAPVSKEINP